ncbi:C-type mannose receptor 2-like [Glandiceps talaboti]
MEKGTVKKKRTKVKNLFRRKGWDKLNHDHDVTLFKPEVVLSKTDLLDKDCARCRPGCKCESGWEYFLGKCYYAYKGQKFTYEESKTICEGKEGSLATINSDDETLFVYIFSEDAYNLWIGANNITSDGNWQWQDGSPVSYSNWVSRELNVSTGENCGHLLGDAKWNAEDCQTKLGFLCQQYHAPIPIDTGCKAGWESFKDHCYFVSTAATHRYAKAQKACEKTDSHLVIINNAGEQSFIEGLLIELTHNVWIGLNDIQKEGKWKWEDGSKLSKKKYSNWHTGEPNNGGGNEDCAHININENYEWNDIACTTKFGYICEKE